MLELELYYCDECQYLVELLSKGGVELECCHQKMRKLVPNTTDAAQEKHVPVAQFQDDNRLFVQVGSVEHPMTEEHFIQTIYVVTDEGNVYRKNLKPGESPEGVFDIANAKKVEVYAYCNLHGLWKASFER